MQDRDACHFRLKNPFYYHWYCYSPRTINSFNFCFPYHYIRRHFSVVFMDAFLSVKPEMSMSLYFLLPAQHDTRSVGINLFITFHCYVPENCSFIVFLLQLILHLFDFDFITLTNCSVEICCSFVLPLYVFCFGPSID